MNNKDVPGIIADLRAMDVPGKRAYILEGCAADALEQLQKENEELKRQMKAKDETILELQDQLLDLPDFDCE